MRDRGDIDARSLAIAYRGVRAHTERIVAPLEIEDWVAQSMPDASPAKWHAAHTSWFFESFVLAELDAAYRSPDARYAFLFNSYYEAMGARQRRSERGVLTRPTVRDVKAYRRHVDDAMEQVLDALARGVGAASERREHWLRVIELGLHHEQQHQELLLTDVKHLFAQNALRPAYAASSISSIERHTDARSLSPLGGERAGRGALPSTPERHTDVRSLSPLGGERAGRAAVPSMRPASGVVVIGHDGAGFAFDNERPRHRVYVAPFEIATRLVTCGEMREFIEDRGYARPELWLSDGWDWVRANGVVAPLYWEIESEGRSSDARIFTLTGMRTIDPHEPVCHVSFYEADAFARWAGARLPTEHEWEHTATSTHASLDTDAVAGGDAIALHPAHAPSGGGLASMHGTVWQWTASAYLPYPGYRPAAGALGEYNGKFMSGQMVLRGSSCFTPRHHARHTYRNFFPPSARWQMTGIRLARDAGEEHDR